MFLESLYIFLWRLAAGDIVPSLECHRDVPFRSIQTQIHSGLHSFFIVEYNTSNDFIETR
jgi:hypothetical protein